MWNSFSLFYSLYFLSFATFLSLKSSFDEESNASVHCVGIVGHLRSFALGCTDAFGHTKWISSRCWLPSSNRDPSKFPTLGHQLRYIPFSCSTGLPNEWMFISKNPTSLGSGGLLFPNWFVRKYCTDTACLPKYFWLWKFLLLRRHYYNITCSFDIFERR